VDSLVLHSGYSNIRLESFLFTQQTYEDVRRHLKPDGNFVIYNYFRQGWLAARLQKGLEEVFGAGNSGDVAVPQRDRAHQQTGTSRSFAADTPPYEMPCATTFAPSGDDECPRQLRQTDLSKPSQLLPYRRPRTTRFQRIGNAGLATLCRRRGDRAPPTTGFVLRKLMFRSAGVASWRGGRGCC
jgi:hypothetical protein